MSKIDSQIGRRIMTTRNNVGYTRDGLAAKIEISSKFLYEIEYGKKGFGVDILSKISTVLSVSSDYILFGDCMDENSDTLLGLLREEEKDKRYIIQLVNRFERRDVKRLKSIIHIMVDINKVK